jgi:hypothetical protein
MEQFQQVAVTLVLVHKVGDGTIHDGSSMSTSTVFVTGLSIDSTDLHARAKLPWNRIRQNLIAADKQGGRCDSGVEQTSIPPLRSPSFKLCL